jgi:ethanolamine utilization protein EutA (predicted chaperonin)
MKPVKRFFLAHEAHMASAFLESHGIDSQVKSDVISQVYNFGTPSNPLIELLVHEEDLEKAKSLIETSFEEDIGESYEETPEGDTTRVANASKLIWGLFALLFLVFLLLWLKR